MADMATIDAIRPDGRDSNPMTPTPEFIAAYGPLVLGGLIVLALLVAWMLWRQKSLLEQLREDRIRMQTREEDQLKLDDSRGRTLEERFRDLDKGLNEGQSNTRALLERRLGEAQTHQVETGGILRTELVERFDALQKSVGDHLADGRTQTVRAIGELREQLNTALGNHQTRFEQRQGDAIKALQETLQGGMQVTQKQVADALTRSSEEVGKRVEVLTKNTDDRLKEISGQVDKRLTEGFEKTTATFADVVKRLALIDEAQKKITELSLDVVSLQEVLSDKRSRGAFGEVQLNSLIRNVLPESHFALQFKLSNDKVVDCMLFLPQPTGNVAIDAKFPLEAFQRMTDLSASETERKSAERQFKADIRKHIQDIAEKYIIRGETADGAVMFIPAEAVFAEIQAHHMDLVQESHQRRVWMVSPTTFMAILNTARAVIKDEATREQVHIIQAHLGELAKDFTRFQARMDKLSTHINQAKDDVDKVHVSATKITKRFEKIESVELEHDQAPAIEHDKEAGD
jgi:DNA recombination protein RmuC